MVEDADIERRSISELLGMVASVAPADLVERAGSLSRLSSADTFEIAAYLEARAIDDRADRDAPRPRTPTRAVMRAARALAAAFELGRRAEIDRVRPPEKIASAKDVARWAAPRITSLPHEELWMLALDGRGHLRAARCIARGGLHGAAVRAADPLRAALRVDASAFVLVHNHPSGDPTPSREDAHLTASVASAAEVVGLVLLDHVVVARTGFSSIPIAGETPPARTSPSAHTPSPANAELTPCVAMALPLGAIQSRRG